jgi:hypothetical protein
MFLDMKYAPGPLYWNLPSKDQSGLRGNELELHYSHPGKESKEEKNTTGLPCEVTKRRVSNFLPS